MTENKNPTEKVEKTFPVSYNVKLLTQSDKRKVVGKFLLYLGASIVLTLAIFFLSLSLVDVFPDYVPISTADELSKIMIEANGLLLGFVGIIFAQLLSSVMSQETDLYKNMLDNPEKVANTKRFLDYLDYRKTGLSVVAVSTFFFLLMSMFLSMLSIAKNSEFLPTDTYATFSFLFGPLLFTIIAIVFMVLAFTVLPMRPQLEEKK